MRTLICRMMMMTAMAHHCDSKICHEIPKLERMFNIYFFLRNVRREKNPKLCIHTTWTLMSWARNPKNESWGSLFPCQERESEWENHVIDWWTLLVSLFSLSLSFVFAFEVAAAWIFKRCAVTDHLPTNRRLCNV